MSKEKDWTQTVKDCDECDSTGICSVCHGDELASELCSYCKGEGVCPTCCFWQVLRLDKAILGCSFENCHQKTDLLFLNSRHDDTLTMGLCLSDANFFFIRPKRMNRIDIVIMKKA